MYTVTSCAGVGSVMHDCGVSTQMLKKIFEKHQKYRNTILALDNFFVGFVFFLIAHNISLNSFSFDS